MDQENYKQIISGLKQILSELHKTQQSLQNRLDALDEKYVLLGEWKIYHEILNRDLRNLGDKIREVERNLELIRRENNKQNLQLNTISTKVATILGIVGGLGGLGAILWKLIGG